MQPLKTHPLETRNPFNAIGQVSTPSLHNHSEEKSVASKMSKQVETWISRKDTPELPRDSVLNDTIKKLTPWENWEMLSYAVDKMASQIAALSSDDVRLLWIIQLTLETIFETKVKDVSKHVLLKKKLSHLFWINPPIGIYRNICKIVNALKNYSGPPPKNTFTRIRDSAEKFKIHAYSFLDIFIKNVFTTDALDPAELSFVDLGDVQAYLYQSKAVLAVDEDCYLEPINECDFRFIHDPDQQWKTERKICTIEELPTRQKDQFNSNLQDLKQAQETSFKILKTQLKEQYNPCSDLKRIVFLTQFFVKLTYEKVTQICFAEMLNDKFRFLRLILENITFSSEQWIEFIVNDQKTQMEQFPYTCLFPPGSDAFQAAILSLPVEKMYEAFEIAFKIFFERNIPSGVSLFFTPLQITRVERVIEHLSTVSLEERIQLLILLNNELVKDGLKSLKTFFSKYYTFFTPLQIEKMGATRVESKVIEHLSTLSLEEGIQFLILLNDELEKDGLKSLKTFFSKYHPKITFTQAFIVSILLEKPCKIAPILVTHIDGLNEPQKNALYHALLQSPFDDRKIKMTAFDVLENSSVFLENIERIIPTPALEKKFGISLLEFQSVLTNITQHLTQNQYKELYSILQEILPLFNTLLKSGTTLQKTDSQSDALLKFEKLMNFIIINSHAIPSLLDLINFITPLLDSIIDHESSIQDFNTLPNWCDQTATILHKLTKLCEGSKEQTIVNFQQMLIKKIVSLSEILQVRRETEVKEKLPDNLRSEFEELTKQMRGYLSFYYPKPNTPKVSNYPAMLSHFQTLSKLIKFCIVHAERNRELLKRYTIYLAVFDEIETHLTACLHDNEKETMLLKFKEIKEDLSKFEKTHPIITQMKAFNKANNC